MSVPIEAPRKPTTTAALPSPRVPVPLQPADPSGVGNLHPAIRALLVLGLLTIFMFGVNGLGEGFKSLGRDVLDSFFQATENPFIALMIGILATTLVQSSSVSTSLVVGLVAAPDNPLPLANAIPIIMGANIGTTVTNTIVSLGHMGRKEEFRRAFAVATCHDFFNYIAVLLLFPLEMATGYLRRSAVWLASLMTGLGGAKYDSPIEGLIKSGTGVIKSGIALVVHEATPQAVALIVVSAVLIFTGLFLLVKVMRASMRARVESVVSRALEMNPLLAILVGIIVTVMVQSSSITTSLLVPLAGAGLLSLRQAFPITIGANLGTTVTAFLAALAVTGENAHVGVEIALVHLLFNLTGTMVIYGVPAVRRVPLAAARGLANLAVRSRPLALLYIVVLFYLLPALLTYLNRGDG